MKNDLESVLSKQQVMVILKAQKLDNFLREFIYSVFSEELGNETIPNDELELMKKEFMEAFDENSDNRIELTEMAKILPTEENFILLFHRDNQLDSSVEFMRVSITKL
ncbi:Calbindin-32 [Schistosoma japonicum]|nr:Calbindin-32 [Schistosoma japonicum]